MQLEIDWNGGDRSKLKTNGPRTSRVWVLNGVVVEATGAFKSSIGKRWSSLVGHCLRQGFTFRVVSQECVPHTVKYHKQLLACVNGTLDLLKEPEQVAAPKARRPTEPSGFSL